MQDAIGALLKHRKDHGQESTKKAKSVVTLKLTIQGGAAEDTYAIISNFKRTTPGRPDSVTFAVQEYDAGKAVLIVQSGATSEADVKQDKIPFPDPPADIEKLPKRKAE